MVGQMIEYLSRCPVFDGREININYLDGKPSAYSLDATSGLSVVKRYADGGMLCEKMFVLSMRKENSAAAKRNALVARECEAFERWISEQNSNGVLPAADEGQIPCSLEVSKGFRIVQTASVDVRLEAELRFVFYTEKQPLA